MKTKIVGLALVLVTAGAVSIACSGDDDDSSMSNGGTTAGGEGGTSGTSGSGGKSGSSGSSGSAGKGGTAGNGGGNAGTAGMAGKGGSGGSSAAGTTSGGAGAESGGQPAAGADNGGAAGVEGGAGGAGGAGPTYTPEQVARGAVIVKGEALCGGCHGGSTLGGNPSFKNGTLPAPNLTPDATGLGDWSDEQIIDAFRNGIDDEGRHLDPAMPYWLFHNMSDEDALSVVAYLRSLTPVSGEVGASNPDATPVTPLSPSSFPNSTLQPADAGYAEAQTGKYLVSGVAQCVRCHSPSTSGLPSGSLLSGATPPDNNTTQFGSNLTPDATGLSGWTATDIVTALKAGTAKGGATLCGAMPSASKGYGNMTDADAHAIGVYLTTIPAIPNAASSPSLEPSCP